MPLTVFTGKEIRLDSWRGRKPSQLKLARIQINVGPAKASCVVAVIDNLDCPALLGIDLGKVFMTSVLTQCLAQNNSDSGVPVEVESVAPEQGGQIKPSDESVVDNKAADGEVAHPKVVVGGPKPDILENKQARSLEYEMGILMI